ncbi:MAG: DHH family phosphoesterase [Patescibacteria group bacterium]
MYIVSAGKAFNDVDAFACAVAYAELLKLEGKESVAVFIGPLNHTVSPLCLKQNAEYLLMYDPKPEDRLVYVDLSDPAHFAFPDLPESQIEEIYDHHYGWEEYWSSRLNERSHIERVGAAATQIWEEFKKRGHQENISASSANLLLIAILQNTLNFTSSETNERDHLAFRELMTHGSLEVGWQDVYLKELARYTHEYFAETLKNDTKIVDGIVPEQKLIFSQLEIMEDPQKFFSQYQEQIDAFWSSFVDAKTLINIADISSKKSLLYSKDSQWLHETVAVLFKEVFSSGPDWSLIPIHQRKQILKLFQEQLAK